MVNLEKTHIDNIPSVQRFRILSLMKDLSMVVAEKKDLEEAEKEIKNELISEMNSVGLDYVDNGEAEIMYHSPTIQRTVESAKLKSDYPEIYELYSKPSNKAGYLSFSKKKGVDSDASS